MVRGAFIVIEGVDRCGKTSQTAKLIDSLKKLNVQVEQMGFPDRTTWTGQVISKYLSDKTCKLNDQAIHLLFTANRWENVERMKEKLNNGITLIVDRYFYSGVAFSTAKGMSMDWCIQPEIGLLKPDLVLYLKIKSETQRNRPGFGTERYETLTMQERVRNVYEKFEKTEDNWRVIDANGAFDAVHMELLQNIQASIKNIANNNTKLQYFLRDSDKENNFNNH
ncbi:hypothetical protein FQA39_LY02978 [Lamprigera yunnana]|nr:hypothetical protein FQA39_LY02978 [Lamprigera yunnana]